MKKQRQKKAWERAVGLLIAFVLWTAAVSRIDVRAIGPEESSVGFSTWNGFIHNLTGVHWSLYTITDWLGLVPIGVAMGFALLGLLQWIKRKRVCKVDRSILALGGLYIAMAAAFLFFEECVINYRPVLINGCLEASYPSSTTLLVLTVMPAAAMQLNVRVGNPVCKRAVLIAIKVFTVFMVAGRFFSGVHWTTDIIGGMLLSACLVGMYEALSTPCEH